MKFEPAQLFLVRSAIVELEDELEDAYQALMAPQETSEIDQHLQTLLSRLAEQTTFINTIANAES